MIKSANDKLDTNTKKADIDDRFFFNHNLAIRLVELPSVATVAKIHKNNLK